LLLFDFSFDQAIRLNNEQNTCMKTDKKEKEGKSGTTTQTTTDEATTTTTKKVFNLQQQEA